MKIVNISDTHGHLPMDLPIGDVLCICGDIVPLRFQRSDKDSMDWLVYDFIDWLWDIKKLCNYKHICIVAGNHDFVFQNRSYEVQRLLEDVDGVHYLCDSSVEIEGHIFYGSPWCPQLKNWAFYKNREDLLNIFETMPQNIDVLMTHCPPDINQIGVVLQRNYNYLTNFGSWELSQALRTRNIKWVVSGHIHSGDHEVSIYNNDICIMKLANVSMKDEDYEIHYKPFIFEL